MFMCRLYNLYYVGSNIPISRSTYPPVIKRLAEVWESSIKRAYEVTEAHQSELNVFGLSSDEMLLTFEVAHHLELRGDVNYDPRLFFAMFNKKVRDAAWSSETEVVRPLIFGPEVVYQPFIDGHWELKKRALSYAIDNQFDFSEDRAMDLALASRLQQTQMGVK